jgi:SAM-dependent methyltransferase
MSGPRTGDAFGAMLRDAQLATERARVAEIVERDDGFIRSGSPARYFAQPAEWEPFERRALDLVRGRVLDVGCGTGRFALALQERDIGVTALDISAGAIQVARTRGVRDAVCADPAAHAAAAGDGYDTFLLMGENLGLLESRERAPALLASLAAVARPGARIIGHGADPGLTGDPVHDTYAKRNGELGRMAGQMTIRVRHRDLATPWFEYLLCGPEELSALAATASWTLTSVDRVDPVNYLAVLTHQP